MEEMVEICLLWPKSTKREFARTRTRAEGLKTLKMGFYRLRKLFECKNAGRKDVCGQELVGVGQKLEIGE